MGKKGRISRGLGALTALGLVAATSACSYASQEDVDSGMASLRAEMLEEMQTGDEAVSDELGQRLTGMERRMAALESDLAQMEQDFEVSIQRLQDELRFNVPVYFAYDDATVGEEGEAVLERFASVAQSYYPDALITVEGFTDPSGPEAYNLDLGQRRATAVADYLTGNTDVAQDRVRAVSYGEDTRRLVMPEGSGPGTEGWQNRRVVLVIDHDGEAPAMPTTVERPVS